MEKRKYLTKVLLIDSDEKFLDYEKQLLENIVPGSIFLALDGRQAYNIFREYYPDIIIMNSVLPLMNGNELISKIRETQTLIDTQIIVINDKYDGVIPLSIHELKTLPGIGDYTANMVLSIVLVIVGYWFLYQTARKIGRASCRERV